MESEVHAFISLFSWVISAINGGNVCILIDTSLQVLNSSITFFIDQIHPNNHLHKGWTVKVWIEFIVCLIVHSSILRFVPFV